MAAVAAGSVQNNPPAVQEQRNQADSPKVLPGRISGRVVRADNGRPLPKAVVTLVPAAQPREGVAVRTDSAGVFHFKEVAPGTYRLRVQRNGFVSQLYGQRGAGPDITVAVEPGRHLDSIEFKLQAAGVIAGRVVDEDYEPIEGLMVHALRLVFEPGGRRRVLVVRTTRTDDVGNYRLPGLAPGFYYVQAGGQGDAVSINLQASAFTYSPNYFPNVASREQAERIQVAPGAEVRGIDIPARSTGTFAVTGVILDTAAAEGIGRRSYSVGFARGGGTATTALEGRDGSFALRGLAPGEYLLVGSVSEEGKPIRRGYVNVQVVDSDLRVAIDVGGSAEVRGKAHIEEDDKGFSFARLRLQLMPETGDAVFGSTTFEENGEFGIRNLPEGRYVFEVFGDDQVYLRQAKCRGEDQKANLVDLAGGKVLGDCELLLSRDAGEVAGEVRDADKPAEGLVVVLIPVELERRHLLRHTTVARTDSNGQFRIRGVIPGEYLAFAAPPSDDAAYYDLEYPERNRQAAKRVTVKAREQQTISLKPTNPF